MYKRQIQVVLHEVAHSWDPQSAAFRKLSGWTGSQQKGWKFKSSAKFTDDYGKTSPLEDFATSFAAVFMHAVGLQYLGGPGASAIPSKVNWIKSFLRRV